MGLDMYFTAKKTLMPGLGKEAEADAIKYDLLATTAGFTQEDTDKFTGYKTAELDFTIGYWRKFYDLHQWFVNNCQYGEDNCRPYTVTKEALEELKAALEETLADPSTRTDNFGHETDPEDDWDYFRDNAEETLKLVDFWLSPTFESWYFQYQASW